MKYDLVTMVNRLLKENNMKELTKAQIKALNEINNSGMPELNALHTYRGSIGSVVVGDNEKMRITLLDGNLNYAFINLDYNGNFLAVEHDSNNIYVEYSNDGNKDEQLKLKRFIFNNEGDIIAFEKSNEDDTVSIKYYNNCNSNSIGIPDYAVPDLVCELSTDCSYYPPGWYTMVERSGLLYGSRTFFIKSGPMFGNKEYPLEIRSNDFLSTIRAYRAIGEKISEGYNDSYSFNQKRKVLKMDNEESNKYNI
jgi:hypothetical protein